MDWKEKTEAYFKFFKDLEKEMMEKLGIPSFTYTDLQLKILNGYVYTILSGKTIQKEERTVNLYTGKGGVLMYIDACKNSGIPAIVCAESIYVSTDAGQYCILEVTIKKD